MRIISPPALAWLERVFLFLVGAMLVGLGLLQRLPQLLNPFTQDEYLHFMPALMGRHFSDFVDKIGPNLQPGLDFWLLRFLWIPLLGFKELPLRLHALFPSLLSIVVVYLGTYWFLRRERLPFWGALLGASAMGLWMATHWVDVFHAGTVRHYTVVGLVSLAWWGLYVLAKEPVGSRRFLFVSFLFLNVHFFAWPLVAAVYGLEAFGRVRRGEKLGWIPLTASLALIFFGSILLNHSAFQWLAAGNVQPRGNVSLLAILGATAATWKGFFDYSDWGFVIVVLFGLFLAVFRLRAQSWADSRELRFFFCFFLLQPCIYFLCMRSSSYPFAPRYHSLFLGAAWTAPLLAWLGYSWLWEERVRLLGRGLGWHYAVLASFVLVFLFSAKSTSRSFEHGQAFSWKKIRAGISGLNYSQNFREQNWAQSQKLPLLWIHDACWESDNPNYYLAYNSEQGNDPQGLGGAYPFGFLIANLSGCEHDFSERRRAIDTFFSLHRESLVVLRLKEESREACLGRLPPLAAAGARGVGRESRYRVEFAPEEISGRCLLAVQGLQSREELRKVFAPLLPDARLLGP